MMAAGRILTAGRSESNDIVIEHPTVSRRHIELRINDDGSFDVIDLGASAGTFVFHNGEWTRFEHATVAGDERLRLASYETTADALIDMAGGDIHPAEDVHEVTTHRRGDHRSSAAQESAPEEDSEGEERTTRRKTGGDTKRIANPSKKGPQTKKLPAGHETSKARSGPAPRPRQSRAKAEPQAIAKASLAETASAAPDITRPEIDAPAQKTSKSLVVAYLLWFFLGSFGAHRFYLGSIRIATAQAALLLIGLLPIVVFGGVLFDDVIPTIFFLLGVAVLTCLVVWLIVDAFLIPGIIRDRNSNSGAKDE